MNTDPLLPITESDIETFERDGVVHVKQVFDPEWVERMRDAVASVYGRGQHFEKLNPEGTEGLFYYNAYLWKENDDFRALAFESPAAKVGAALMRSTGVTLICDVIFHKEPHSDHATPWHHDQPYWYVDGRQAIGMWISLDRVNLQSGAMEYVRGSHNWGTWYEPANFDITGTKTEFTGDESEALRDEIEAKGADGFEPMPDIPSNRDEYDIVSFETEPGDVLVNHMLTLHGAPGNRTERPRRAVAFRFVGDDARYAVRKADFRLKPPGDPKLSPGAPFPPDHEWFPQVWPRR